MSEIKTVTITRQEYADAVVEQNKYMATLERALGTAQAKVKELEEQVKGNWHKLSEAPIGKDGVRADIFLVIPLDSDAPKTMYYFYEEKYWTEGGGDKQRIRYWMPIDWMWVKKEAR